MKKFQTKQMYIVDEEPFQFTFTRQGHGDKYTVECIRRTALSDGKINATTDFSTFKYPGVYQIREGIGDFGGLKIEFEEMKDGASTRYYNAKTGRWEWDAKQRPPEGFRIDPRYVELKSKRFNALLKPSIYNRLKEESRKTGLSVNELINRTLESAFPERDKK